MNQIISNENQEELEIPVTGNGTPIKLPEIKRRGNQQ